MRAAAAFFASILLVPHLSAAQPSGVAAPPSAYRKGSIDWEVYAGGALLPFGGHKGSGFSLLAQFIGRGLAQMDPSGYDGPRGVNGPFILAIDIARFTDLEQFRSEVEAQCAAVTGCLPAEGVEAVLLPGQPELAIRATRERDGVPIPDTTWQELEALARAHRVALRS